MELTLLLAVITVKSLLTHRSGITITKWRGMSINATSMMEPHNHFCLQRMCLLDVMTNAKTLAFSRKIRQFTPKCINATHINVALMNQKKIPQMLSMMLSQLAQERKLTHMLTLLNGKSNSYSSFSLCSNFWTERCKAINSLRDAVNALNSVSY